MTDDLMTIREMCDAFDVTPRTLRFYEAKELIFPHRHGTKRLFTKRDRARLKLILRGKRFGFSLEEIRQWLLLYEEKGSTTQYREFLRLADRQLAVLAEEREKLEGTIKELAQLRAETAAQIGDS